MNSYGCSADTDGGNWTLGGVATRCLSWSWKPGILGEDTNVHRSLFTDSIRPLASEVAGATRICGRGQRTGTRTIDAAVSEKSRCDVERESCHVSNKARRLAVNQSRETSTSDSSARRLAVS